MRRTSLPDVRLELAPLIDVVFVLLAFFILALVVSTRLELTDILVPEARAGAGDPTLPSSSVIVALTPEGEVLVDERPVALEELGEAVRIALEQTPAAELVVAPDRAAPSGRLLGLLDALGEAGYPDLRIVRLPAREGQEGS